MQLTIILSFSDMAPTKHVLCGLCPELITTSNATNHYKRVHGLSLEDYKRHHNPMLDRATRFTARQQVSLRSLAGFALSHASQGTTAEVLLNFGHQLLDALGVRVTDHHSSYELESPSTGHSLLSSGPEPSHVPQPTATVTPARQRRSKRQRDLPVTPNTPAQSQQVSVIADFECLSPPTDSYPVSPCDLLGQVDLVRQAAVSAEIDTSFESPPSKRKKLVIPPPISPGLEELMDSDDIWKPDTPIDFGNYTLDTEEDSLIWDLLSLENDSSPAYRF